MVQNEFDLTHSESVDILLKNKKLTSELLKDLHGTFLAPQREMIQEMFSKNSKEELTEPPFSKFDFFTRDGSMQEAIFYSGDGVYDFQYLEYLPLKYKYDAEWLEEKRGFYFQQVIYATQTIKAIQQEKANTVGLIDLRDYEPHHLLKKDIKGKDKDKRLEELLTQLEFIQFYALFPPIPDDSKLSENQREELWESNWDIFYDNLLDLFILDKFCLSNIEAIDKYLSNFGLLHNERNNSFNNIGDFNIINSKPIIQLSNGKWFLPVYYLLTEAVYESPYYCVSTETVNFYQLTYKTESTFSRNRQMQAPDRTC